MNPTAAPFDPAHYPENSVSRLMEPPVAVFLPTLTVGEATEIVRDLTAHTRVFTYGYIVDATGVLVGVITMRDLLLHSPEESLEGIMLAQPFALNVNDTVLEAIRATVQKHYPSYPVCDDRGVMVGIVRGSRLFEEQAIEISAQAGAMVGVEREERANTPFWQCLKFRHPWLQFNLLTAFIAAAVVGFFEGTIERIVVLAVFLPVLAGQSGNTGCQALAVALRNITLGDLKPETEKSQFAKEAALGLVNGALVGITAGLGMYFYATWQETGESPLKLATTVFVAMTGSCFISGVSGVMVPVTLKKLGADPATASSIFLTTATDVASMGIFLGIATFWMM